MRNTSSSHHALLAVIAISVGGLPACGDTDDSGSAGSSSSSSSNGSGSTSASSGGGSSGSSTGGSSSGSSTGGSSAGGSSTGGGGGSSGEWPGPDNTGVPDGIALTDYAGPCTITTPNTVIDSKTIDCDVQIKADNVTIKNSKINGTVNSGGAEYHFEVIDSEVDGTPDGPDQVTSVGSENFLLLRVEVTGGNRSVSCEHDCEVRDSWLHGQEMPDDVDWHLSAIRLSQRSRVIHNTLSCDKPPNNVDGGCSANQTGYPDFEPTKDWLMEGNLLKGNEGVAYCSYGGATPTKPYSDAPDNATNIVYKNNVFERGTNGNCGAYGPITSFDETRPGNEWVNNTWDDGTNVPPAN